MTTPEHSAATPLRVTVQDLRRARYCLAGARPWFRRHGFDWQDFLTHGIAAERLMAADATLARPVIRAAEARAASEDREAGKADHERG